ncbi:MAG: FtsX-like permease family protein [Planctomycetia bacterium]|nr:FtsX-like permease family protein [Planctomycetia bacterium]
MGFTFQPVKRQALQAAAGTTPFDVLFLSFSAFLIAAALMLLAVLFRLGVERRASQIGLLMAIGLSRRKVARLLAVEGAMVAAVGGVVGVLLGIGYAWLLLAGLRSWWISAVSTPLLTLHVEWKGLAVGYAAGVGVCILAIVLTLRSIRKVGARSLLHGEFSVAPVQTGVSGKRSGAVRIVAFVLLGAAVLLAVVAGRFEGEAQTGVFFGSGALTLTAALVAVWSVLRSPRSFDGSAARLSLGWLARRNAARNPGRSALAIGLTAIATFLIVATSAFRLDVLPSGSGGFNLLAESSAPVHRDLNTPAGRFELGITGGDETQLAASTVAALRVHDGDDASCQNLYRPGQPKILGVPPTLAELCRGSNRFDWGTVAQSAALTRHDRSLKDIKNEEDSPWRLLDEPVSGNPSAVPVILDENTARYSLNLWGGVGDTLKIRDAQGRDVTLSVVGLLKNSVFQGSLLISERQLLKLFPDTSGYRYFLIRTPADQVAAVRGVLEDRLGDYGFAVTPASRRLADLFAVQNTYIGAFQSLGGLGLLLGTFSLAAVQLRSVLERRGELALLRAVGFSRRRLVSLVLAEHRLLLIGGLAIGLGAALLAVWPHLAGGRARIPWESLAITLGAVLTLGLAAGWLAVRATLRAPLVPALRSE